MTRSRVCVNHASNFNAAFHCALCTVCCVLSAVRDKKATKAKATRAGGEFSTTGERAQSIINAKHAKQNKKKKRDVCLRRRYSKG